MSLYPEVQKAAQAELDTVVGAGRLPEFADRDKLPYINAVVKEIMRWYPVAPLGLARLNTADDIYNGYLIPKGSIVMVNIWYVLCSSSWDTVHGGTMINRSIMNDPEVFPEPEKFMPERFLKDGALDTTVRDPFAFLFGLGRR